MIRFDSLIGAALVVVGGWVGACCGADDRPNIVWISCEDISPNLGCYGDPHAITPNLDRLAADGVRFDRAFTPAGVCAVVRSSIIRALCGMTAASSPASCSWRACSDSVRR